MTPNDFTNADFANADSAGVAASSETATNEQRGTASQLQTVPLVLGEQIYGVNEHLNSVYFPTTGIVSLLNAMENGSSSEIGIVGNDGVLGIALFMGGNSVASQAVVQSAGGAFRLPA